MKFLFLLCLLASCGYRFGDRAIIDHYQTISVSYVAGDADGRLTEAIIKEIGTSSPLTYCAAGGRLLLEAKIVCCSQQNIGYQYDIDKKGKRTNRTVPNEGRLIYAVEFCVIDTAARCKVMGPIQIQAEADYDFDPLAIDNEIAIFSIGQYVLIDQAEEAALNPLYDQLARKMVAYLSSAW